MMNEISLNDRLPSFSLEATILNTCSDKDMLGHWVVLFIYPKDNTTGCTRETKEFNERYSEFKSLGVKVFGLSKDTLASHISFSRKLDLHFSLISDPQTQLIRKLNAWKEKSMYGKKYMGAERSTFLIDKNLIVKNIWRKVKVGGHVDQIFDKCKELIL
ncbi:MAG: peroxiredoxin [Rhodobacteraceae bacterium]|nr:peroxiredoxin [Paracoccaceae bacterium]|tara:strand:- start:130 stop:606 length:477 start_codon:yes stop_codon:yes gene_type:complete